MTGSEKKKLRIIEDRVRTLTARLDATPKDATFRPEIRRELEAMQWAVKRINACDRYKQGIFELERLLY